MFPRNPKCLRELIIILRRGRQEGTSIDDGLYPCLSLLRPIHLPVLSLDAISLVILCSGILWGHSDSTTATELLCMGIDHATEDWLTKSKSFCIIMLSGLYRFRNVLVEADYSEAWEGESSRKWKKKIKLSGPRSCLLPLKKWIRFRQDDHLMCDGPRLNKISSFISFQKDHFLNQR